MSTTSSSTQARNGVGNQVPAGGVLLSVRWGGQNLVYSLSPADWETLTVLELKQRLDAELDVPQEKMRFMGISGPGGSATIGDSVRIQELTFKKAGREILLVGTARRQQLQDTEMGTARKQQLQGTVAQPEPDWGTGIHSDWHSTARRQQLQDTVAEAEPDRGSVIRSDLHLQRLQAAIQMTEIRVINAPRAGKRLLVLDLDYTVFDCKSSAPIMECKRPFTDEFLAQVYPYYDIVIWSQTKWHWVEAKLTELGLLMHRRFCIAWCMDRSSMFTVTSFDRHGETRIHEVKALEIIWAKFPEYGAHNTVHVDDVSRNFALNPLNGIEVSPFHVKNGRGDNELEHLTAYLLSLVAAPDLSKVDHSQWKINFTG